MKIKFLSCLLWGICIVGCTSQDKKKTEESEAVATLVPKNFARAMPPALMTDPQERATYMVAHFWDNFNFKDTMYCHVPDITEQAFADYISLLPHVPYDKVCAEVHKLLDLASVENIMYNYFFQKAEYYLYNPNSPLRNDEFYIPFLEHVVTSQKVTEASKVRARYQLELAKKNRPGNKALDFTYTLHTGATGHLYGVAAKYTLLMFYNPDCGECKQTTAMLKGSSVISAAISSGKLKVLALYPDENLDAWKHHLQDYPSTWINGYDKSLAIKNDEIYDLKAIPTLYLLDKDKKVIFKDTSTGEIHEYLEQNP